MDALNVHIPFFTFQTSHKRSCSHCVQLRDSNHTHALINDLSMVKARPMTTCVQTEKKASVSETESL